MAADGGWWIAENKMRITKCRYKKNKKGKKRKIFFMTFPKKKKKEMEITSK